MLVVTVMVPVSSAPTACTSDSGFGGLAERWIVCVDVLVDRQRFAALRGCDLRAGGVIAAVRELDVKVPVVVRMKGNNEEKGRKMLAESGLNFETADDMTEAADKVVAAAGGAR